MGFRGQATKPRNSVRDRSGRSRWNELSAGGAEGAAAGGDVHGATLRGGGFRGRFGAALGPALAGAGEFRGCVACPRNSRNSCPRNSCPRNSETRVPETRNSETRNFCPRNFRNFGGDEVIHCILDLMYAKAPYTVLQHAMHIHPTVSECFGAHSDHAGGVEATGELAHGFAFYIPVGYGSQESAWPPVIPEGEALDSTRRSSTAPVPPAPVSASRSRPSSIAATIAAASSLPPIKSHLSACSGMIRHRSGTIRSSGNYEVVLRQP